MRDELRQFIAHVANSAIKIRVLEFFLGQRGVCIGSAPLAEKLQAPHDQVHAAIQELSEHGALTFCPYFGYSDLYLMNPNYQTETMRQSLIFFRFALRHAPEEIASHFAND